MFAPNRFNCTFFSVDIHTGEIYSYGNGLEEAFEVKSQKMYDKTL